MPARLTICSHCLFSICNIYLFPVFVLREGFLAFDGTSSCSLLFYYFFLYHKGESAFLFIIVSIQVIVDLAYLCAMVGEKSLQHNMLRSCPALGWSALQPHLYL